MEVVGATAIHPRTRIIPHNSRSIMGNPEVEACRLPEVKVEGGEEVPLLRNNEHHQWMIGREVAMIRGELHKAEEAHLHDRGLRWMTEATINEEGLTKEADDLVLVLKEFL